MHIRQAFRCPQCPGDEAAWPRGYFDEKTHFTIAPGSQLLAEPMSIVDWVAYQADDLKQFVLCPSLCSSILYRMDVVCGTCGETSLFDNNDMAQIRKLKTRMYELR